jgi:hypothetical protein
MGWKAPGQDCGTKVTWLTKNGHTEVGLLAHRYSVDINRLRMGGGRDCARCTN